jgi:hypothetical protein
MAAWARSASAAAGEFLTAKDGAGYKTVVLTVVLSERIDHDYKLNSFTEDKGHRDNAVLNHKPQKNLTAVPPAQTERGR